MSAFTEATAVRPAGAGYDVDLHPGWVVAGRPHGGYLLALVARAAVDTSRHPHPVAVSAHFLASPACAPAQVTVAELRHGRTTAVHRAQLAQGGRTVLDAVVTTATLDPGAVPDWSRSTPPDLPPPERCVRLDAGSPGFLPVPLLDRLDLRMDPASLGFATGRPSGRLEMRGWMRLGDRDDPDPYALLVAVDALPPSVWDRTPGGWSPTVELTFHLRALPAPGWLLVSTHTTSVHDGWSDEVAEVWDSRGRLVAQSRQLARISTTPVQGFEPTRHDEGVR